MFSCFPASLFIEWAAPLDTVSDITAVAAIWVDFDWERKGYLTPEVFEHKAWQLTSHQ